jgi:hypothetical protein
MGSGCCPAYSDGEEKANKRRRRRRRGRWRTLGIGDGVIDYYIA